MRWVNITPEALAMIYRNAGPTFRSEAKKLSDGSFDIPLSEETIEVIHRRMLSGETISECIIRVFSSVN